MTPLPKIFAFINGGINTDWVTVAALSEDGNFLAEHVCSHEGYAKHDIGITSDWKHDSYAAHYPDGYELLWVDGNPTENALVMDAYGKHIVTGASTAGHE